MGPGYEGTTTNLQIVLNIPPKKSLLNSSHPKLSQNRKFQTPKKPSIISVTWIRISPLHPPGTCLALTEHRGNLAMAYWNEKTLGTRKRTNDVINFRLVQTNKQQTTELLLTAHKWLQKIMQFLVHTVLLSNRRDGLSLEVSSKQVKEVYVI